MNNIHKLIQQAVLYTSGIVLLYSLVFDMSWGVFGWLVVANVMVSLLISAYYHRMLCHLSWRPHRTVEVMLAVMAAGHGFAPAISWAAVHRKHHRFSDTANDPHGPHRGFLANSALAFYPTDLKYAGQILRDGLYQFQLKYYFHIMVCYAIVWSACFGLQSWLMINGYVLFSQWMVNYFGHSEGKAVNVNSVAPLLHAEMYHANHHIDPWSPRFGKWDVPYLFIRLLSVDRKENYHRR